MPYFLCSLLLYNVLLFMFFTVILCLTFCVLYYNKMPYFFIFYTDTLCLTFHALNCYPMPYFLCSLLIHYAVLNCYPMPYFLCSAVIHYALLFMLFTDTLCFIICFFLLIHYAFTIHYALLFDVLYVHLILVLQPGGWGQHGSNVQFYDLLLGGKC